MKRILALLLSILTLFILVACDTPPHSTNTDESGTETTPTTQTQTQASPETKDDGPLTIPSGFCAGFARADITPTMLPYPIGTDADATVVRDKVYINAVAVSDGDEVAFLIHLDLKNSANALVQTAMRVIEQETGVPADHVFLTATHSHNAPTNSGSTSRIALWQKQFYSQLRKAVREAYRDLSPATMTGGIADTTGYAFVRRYICEDGSLDGIHMAQATGSPAVRHETEADPDLQVIRFARPAEGKKDIIIANWQAHAAHAFNDSKLMITSDFIHYFRDGVEKNHDAHFAYFNGACGNINLSTRFPELIKYNGSGWVDVGKALVGKLDEALAAATPLQSGEIKAAAGGVDGVHKIDDPERVAQAKEWSAETNNAKKSAILSKYRFQSKYEASTLVTRSTYSSPSTLIPLSAICFGDVAFAASSYEMFDTSGKAVKDGSPYKMTFMCSCTNGSLGYMPSAESFDRGGYEVYTSRFQRGTAELCVTELLRLINAAA